MLYSSLLIILNEETMLTIVDDNEKENIHV